MFCSVTTPTEVAGAKHQLCSLLMACSCCEQWQQVMALVVIGWSAAALQNNELRSSAEPCHLLLFARLLQLQCSYPVSVREVRTCNWSKPAQVHSSICISSSKPQFWTHSQFATFSKSYEEYSSQPSVPSRVYGKMLIFLGIFNATQHTRCLY